MVQNYRRLGLVSRLLAPTGGIEKPIHGKIKTSHALEIRDVEDMVVSEARVERDADGKILRVIHGLGSSRRANPLSDPLNDLDSDDDEDKEEEPQEEWGGIGDDEEEDKTEVVKQLEEEASRPVEKKVRHQSEQELEWIGRLVAKHGDNVAAMVRDRKLNPMQQTKGDIARRIKRWRSSQR